MTDRHRKGYYKEYNRKHPERLERIGIFLDDEDEFNFTNTISDCESDLYDDSNNGIML